MKFVTALVRRLVRGEGSCLFKCFWINVLPKNIRMKSLELKFQNYLNHCTDVIFTADVRQHWTNCAKDGNKCLIIRAVVSSEYSNI